MVVQKKKKVKSNSVNLGVFQWTPKRKRAAKLLSTGLYNYKQTAKEAGITEDTLLAWRQQPIFLQEVDRLTFLDENATRAAIVRKVIKALNIKENFIYEDRSTFLDYLEFLIKVLPAEVKAEEDPLKELADAILESAKMIGK
jgi:transposase-like protein